MAEILFLFSFGVAHPDDPFSIAEPFSKGKQNSSLAPKKEHFMARKRVFPIPT